MVAFGGAVGTLGRWGLQRLVPHADPRAMPWGTLIVNLIGCALMGALIWFLLGGRAEPHRLARPFLGVGVLGGFTTFSAFAVDLRGLIASHTAWTGLAYLVGSVVGGVAMVWLGRAAMSRLAPAPDPGLDVEGAPL